MLGDTTGDAPTFDATSNETADTVDQDGASTTPQPDSADPPAERKGRTAEERINRLLSDRYRERARAEAAEARLRDLESRQQQAPQQSQQPAQSDGEPDQANYDNYLAYQKDLNRWIARQEAKKLLEESRSASREAEQQRTSQETQQAQLRAFTVAGNKLEADLPDFTESLERVPRTQTLVSALLQSDQGAAVAYLLGSPEHEATLERVLAIEDPLKAAMAIARLEGKALEFVQSRGRSKVSPQGKPLSVSGGSPSNAQPGPNDDMAEYMRKFRAHYKGR